MAADKTDKGSSPVFACRETVHVFVFAGETLKICWECYRFIDYLGLLSVCSEEVPGACRDQTAVEDLVRVLIFKFLSY